MSHFCVWVTLLGCKPTPIYVICTGRKFSTYLKFGRLELFLIANYICKFNVGGLNSFPTESAIPFSVFFLLSFEYRYFGAMHEHASCKHGGMRTQLHEWHIYTAEHNSLLTTIIASIMMISINWPRVPAGKLEKYTCSHGWWNINQLISLFRNDKHRSTRTTNFGKCCEFWNWQWQLVWSWFTFINSFKKPDDV